MQMMASPTSLVTDFVGQPTIFELTVNKYEISEFRRRGKHSPFFFLVWSNFDNLFVLKYQLLDIHIPVVAFAIP
jgi:hypothetical protein